MPTGSFSDNYTRFALSIAVRRFKPYIYVCKLFFFSSLFLNSFIRLAYDCRVHVEFDKKNTHFNAKTDVSFAIGIKKGKYITCIKSTTA